MKDNNLRQKLVRFVEGCTPLQLKMLDDKIKSLVKSNEFSALNEPVRFSATGKASLHPQDVEEGNAGTLYRSPE